VCVCVCVFCRIMKDLKYHLSVKEYDIMWIDLSSKEKVKTTGPHKHPGIKPILDLPHICTNLLVYHISSIQISNGTERNLRNAMHIWWMSKSLTGLEKDFHLKNFHQNKGKVSTWIWLVSIWTYIFLNTFSKRSMKQDCTVWLT
jgi:hypothetical protein